MRIVAFGIHPDDVELGCGGTVVLAAGQGHQVTVVDLSEGRASSNGTPEERAAEARAAAVVMGVGERINLGLPDTRIASEDAGQTAAVVACLRGIRPHLVLTSSSDDPLAEARFRGVLEVDGNIDWYSVGSVSGTAGKK